jgi:double-stranded uracil-DNA glycosylase
LIVPIPDIESTAPTMPDSTPLRSWKPTPAQLAAACNTTVPDLIQPGLRVLFCGINPGLYSAAVGHHFARPGNRFWPTLAASGFTPRLFSPFEEEELLTIGLGITNVVARATTAAVELAPAEFVEGARLLEAKVGEHRPRVVAFLGVMAYRTAFSRPKAAIGSQQDMIAGSRIWVLPNPSGRNGHFSLDPFLALYRAVEGASTA